MRWTKWLHWRVGGITITSVGERDPRSRGKGSVELPFLDCPAADTLNFLWGGAEVGAAARILDAKFLEADVSQAVDVKDVKKIVELPDYSPASSAESHKRGLRAAEQSLRARDPASSRAVFAKRPEPRKSVNALSGPAKEKLWMRS